VYYHLQYICSAHESRILHDNAMAVRRLAKVHLHILLFELTHCVVTSDNLVDCSTLRVIRPSVVFATNASGGEADLLTTGVAVVDVVVDVVVRALVLDLEVPTRLRES